MIGALNHVGVATPSIAEEQVAWRHGEKRVPRLLRSRRAAVGESAPPAAGEARTKRVLLTGGLGGLGVSVASHLLRSTKHAVTLASRSGQVAKEVQTLLEGHRRQHCSAAARPLPVLVHAC